MDDNNCVKLLTQHEVNLKILAKYERTHSGQDFLNVSGRYRDEDFAIYKRKRQQFHDSVKEYKSLNRAALKTNRFKTDIEGDISVKFDFLKETKENIADVYTPDTASRKRTLREIHTFPVEDTPENYQTVSQPWFPRFWVLNRFIGIARKLIVKNRLLRRLEKLKSVNHSRMRMLESEGFRIINKHYPQLFERCFKRKEFAGESVSTLY